MGYRVFRGPEGVHGEEEGSYTFEIDESIWAYVAGRWQEGEVVKRWKDKRYKNGKALYEERYEIRVRKQLFIRKGEQLSKTKPEATP